MPDELIDNPILNSPYDEPGHHFAFNDRGVITGEILDGRRRSLYFTPIPGARRGVDELDLGFDQDEVKGNELINQIRERVSLWRTNQNYQGVTHVTRKLLQHWNVIEDRARPLFFCQKEAIETTIYLTEYAGKDHPYFLNELGRYAETISDGLFRQAMKMATGTGKTVVMSLIIAWQTLNKARNPQDGRFTDQFLVVTPGITIRDRLRVLKPNDPGNFYDQLDLIPTALREELNRADIHIVNYHQLMLREKVSAPKATKKLLGESVFTETPDEMANRVLKPLSGKKQIMVLNDEGHHCYQDRSARLPDAEATETEGVTIDDLAGDDKQAAKARDREARVWHTGLAHINRKRGIKTVYDFSATPFYLRGSGWQEGTLFQWVVSDFALTDAIECGIVKIPRVPVSDDVDPQDPAYRSLWAKVGSGLPRGGARNKPKPPPVLPALLETALRSLYSDYEKHFRQWEEALGNHPDAVPPVFIVVAQNTNISKLIYQWMGGWEEEAPDGSMVRHHGALPLFDNIDTDGNWLAKPLSLIVDSAVLDSGEQLSDEFREAAAAELERFKREYEMRNPGRKATDLQDEDLLREVMNTVGTPRTLGAHVRCVVSVSMLTEGWSANTVTHILGVRAFGTQLLCEQVVGRGLRRVSYEIGEGSRFSPEYADIYGVPWTFVPVAGQRTTMEGEDNFLFVHADAARAKVAVRFPRVVGFRYEPPAERLTVEFGNEARLTLGKDSIPETADIEDITGIPESHTLDDLHSTRMQTIRYKLAEAVIRQLATDVEGVRPWLFPQILGLVQRWETECLELVGGAFPQLLGLSQYQSDAALRILGAIGVSAEGDATIKPILDHVTPIGSTHGKGWWTKRDPDDLWVTDPGKCHMNYVVPHSSWERKVAIAAEKMEEVVSYVKNDHLDFTIPYVKDGIQRDYTPDFVLRIDDGGGPGDLLNLLVEVSGQDARDKEIKRLTTETKWVPAVNGSAELGRWAFLEITDPVDIECQLRAAVERAPSPVVPA